MFGQFEEVRALAGFAPFSDAPYYQTLQSVGYLYLLEHVRYCLFWYPVITEVDKTAGLERSYDLICSYAFRGRGGAGPKLGEIDNRNVKG